MKPIELGGKTLDKWTVTHRAPDRGDYVVRWVCRCQCGEAKEVVSITLRRGMVPKCHACAVRDKAISNIWRLMIHRCRPGGKPQYVGRGIKVCDRWHSFEAFKADVGPRPSPRHTLDRINNDGHYEPGNIRWATQKVQANNTRRNRVITIGDRTQTLMAWAEECGAPYFSLVARLNRGWSAERALHTPFAQRREMA